MGLGNGNREWKLGMVIGNGERIRDIDGVVFLVEGGSFTRNIVG